MDEVFRALDPKDVTTLSMGSLRFAPDLKDVVRARIPKSRLMTADCFLPKTAKSAISGRFAPTCTRKCGLDPSYAPDAALYLCMGTQTLWQQTFGHAPSCSADVEQRIQTGKIPLVVA